MTRFPQKGCCEQEGEQKPPTVHLETYNQAEEDHHSDKGPLYEVSEFAVTWETFLEDLHSQT